MIKKTLKWLLVALVTCFIGAQFVRPERRNPPAQEGQAFTAHLNVPGEVHAVLRRACMDCHSNQTEWPWYSNVAPASWFVADHVNHGRRNLNLSAWASYEREEAEHLLADVCKEATAGTMPMRSYLILHPEAKLSQSDIKTLCDWSSAEGRRLASLGSHRR